MPTSKWKQGSLHLDPNPHHIGSRQQTKEEGLNFGHLFSFVRSTEHTERLVAFPGSRDRTLVEEWGAWPLHSHRVLAEKRPQRYGLTKINSPISVEFGKDVDLSYMSIRPFPRRFCIKSG